MHRVGNVSPEQRKPVYEDVLIYMKRKRKRWFTYIDLADELDMNPGGASTALRALERKGLVDVRNNEDGKTYRTGSHPKQQYKYKAKAKSKS